MKLTTHLRNILLLCASLLAIIYQPVRADDLVSIYELSLNADPEYRAAIATHQAAL